VFSHQQLDKPSLGQLSFGTQQLIRVTNRNWKTGGWQDVLLTAGRLAVLEEKKQSCSFSRWGVAEIKITISFPSY